MQGKPAQLPNEEYPGVRSRFDDFVAYVLEHNMGSWHSLTSLRTHINYTLHTHYSGLFLPWHRHFIWLWENALREECGYPGYLP